MVLPDLPEIPLNTLNRTTMAERVQERALPELPDYSQEIKKITVVEVKDDLYNEPITGMEKSSFSESGPKEIKVISKAPPVEKEYPDNKNYIKKNNEIFVKVKKFENALISFDEIKNKVEEMKKDLERAKKIVQDENKELEEWEKELTQMKKGLENIDHNLFTEMGD